MGRDIAANGFTIVIVLLVALAGLAGWARNEVSNEGPLTQAIYFDVARGASLRAVSDDLGEVGAVSSALLFRLNAEYADRSQDLRFGTYEIPAGATMAEILDIVTTAGASVVRYRATFVLRIDGTGEMRLRERVPGSGEVIELATFSYSDGLPEVYADLVAQGGVNYRVSVPEGLTSWQIVQALAEADFLDGEVAEIPDEGTLAPDTYDVARGTERQALLDRMAEAQAATLAAAWETRADDLPIETPQEALILASIIEKETSVPDERGLVASVFVNRLRLDMRLQTDPTVIYGVTEGRGILGRGLRQSELDAVTPWNTYQINGLPPTPIANPGADAIYAALNPDTSDYIFFVADGTGGHAFAETLDEHNANVARWREIEAERGDGG